MIRSLWLTSILVCASIPLVARADDSLDAGFAALDEGDFDVAATAFDAALAGDGLSRPELLALLEARAALHFALHDEAALDADLSWLAALDPGHTFGANRPPDLAQRFVEIEQHHPGALEVAATALPSNRTVRVQAQLAHVPEGMRAELRICSRQEGSAWRCTDGAEMSSPFSASGDLYYYAEAIGPGGAIVGAAGSATEPRHLAAPGAVDTHDAAAETVLPNAGGNTNASGDAPSRGHGLAIGLGVGGGVLAIAAAVVLALTLSGDGGIRVRTPTVR